MLIFVRARLEIKVSLNSRTRTGMNRKFNAITLEMEFILFLRQGF